MSIQPAGRGLQLLCVSKIVIIHPPASALADFVTGRPSTFLPSLIEVVSSSLSPAINKRGPGSHAPPFSLREG